MTWWHRVGQRVKKAALHKCKYSYHEIPIGTEGVIVAVPSERFFMADCDVMYGDKVVGGNWINLEPILPEGHKASTWEECVWKPEHLRVPA